MNFKKSIIAAIKKALEPFIVSAFHYLYYGSSDSWVSNTFLGYKILQCPFDLHLYQELFYRVPPPYVLQTGVAGGGSLLYFASLLDLINAPPSSIVIGIDIELSADAKKLTHPRIRLYEGSSTDPVLVSEIKKILPVKYGLIILDSDHSELHVSKEISIYKEWVQIGSYMVVEDTNINGHPVNIFFGPGPFEAVKKFLENDSSFISDDNLWKRNMFSFHQGGWLKRVK